MVTNLCINLTGSEKRREEMKRKRGYGVCGTSTPVGR